MRRSLYLLPIAMILVLACNLITNGQSTEGIPPEIPPAIQVPTHPPEPNEEIEPFQPTELLTEIPLALPESCPSNDGKLVFASEIDPQGVGAVNFEIFIANSDGSEVNRLTNDDRWDGNPAWSPERCRIAFAENTDQQSNQDIYVMKADGSGLKRLTDDPSFDREPSWSPSGTEIVFMREQDSNRDIFIMAADGSAIRQLTDDPTQDEDPNGRRIVMRLISRRAGMAIGKSIS